MLNNYIKAHMNQMARRTHTYLLEEHKNILKFAYEFYQENKKGPSYLEIENSTGHSKKEVDALFTRGLVSVHGFVDIHGEILEKKLQPLADIDVDKRREIFFDHSATTYVRDEIKSYLKQYANGDLGFANPSSSTLEGKKAFDQIMTARFEIAQTMGVKPDEITFSSSGSEANNIAVKGIAFKYHETKGHIITTQIEHPSIIESVQFLGMLGYDVTFIDVDKNGLITVDAVKEAIESNTILVAIMAVNNEIGIINPIREIGELCKLAEIPFMVDAIQAF
ncbi:MAG: aminotransferase class V-fold PLP-dependent enzyme, partial [Desulfobacteraceae bacterium]|nr:aminotransferase class V-fold PLP-dependent enzyme [Desulfobacteraceae bacterium]